MFQAVYLSGFSGDGSWGLTSEILHRAWEVYLLQLVCVGGCVHVLFNLKIKIPFFPFQIISKFLEGVVKGPTCQV